MPTLYTVTRCGITFKYVVALHHVRQMLACNPSITDGMYDLLNNRRSFPKFCTMVSPLPMRAKPHNRTRRPMLYSK